MNLESNTEFDIHEHALQNIVCGKVLIQSRLCVWGGGGGGGHCGGGIGPPIVVDDVTWCYVTQRCRISTNFWRLSITSYLDIFDPSIYEHDRIDPACACCTSYRRSAAFCTRMLVCPQLPLINIIYNHSPHWYDNHDFIRLDTLSDLNKCAYFWTLNKICLAMWLYNRSVQL